MSKAPSKSLCHDVLQPDVHVLKFRSMMALFFRTPPIYITACQPTRAPMAMCRRGTPHPHHPQPPLAVGQNLFWHLAATRATPSRNTRRDIARGGLVLSSSRFRQRTPDQDPGTLELRGLQPLLTHWLCCQSTFVGFEVLPLVLPYF
jgi:hypothetical protein